MVNYTDVKVRYSETDQMGIVHHSRYFPWFEIGRGELFSQLYSEKYIDEQITYGGMEKMGLMLPLIDASAKYIHGAKYEDLLTVKTYVSQISVVRCTFSYEIIRASDEKIIASGQTTHAFTDTNLKPLNAKKKFPNVYNALLNCIDDTNSKKI